MTEHRILQFDDPAHHHSVQQLLPWYVNGTLHATEAERVRKHLDGCALCRIDFASQRELQTHLKADSGWVDDAPSVESGLAALRERLHKSPQEPRSGKGLPNHAQPAPRKVVLTRMALAAQFAAIVVLSSLLLRRPDTVGGGVLPSPHGTYVTRSASLPGQGSDRLIAAFREEASEASVRALLSEIDARIVDGPTGTGAYVIDVPGGHGLIALQTLKGRATTVRMAEVLALGQHP